RGKPEKFAEHYAQATLFYESQSPVEKAHIAAAFRFELSKVGVPAIRERMVASLVNASPELAAKVADGLGINVPAALPKALDKASAPEIKKSPALSLLALPGECGIRTRQIAIVVANGVVRSPLAAVQASLVEAGAVVHWVGPRVGMFNADEGTIEANKSMENAPSVLFDALVLPDGESAIEILAADGRTMEYIKDQFRHCKAMLAFGAARQLLERAGIDVSSEGVIVAASADAANAAEEFIGAIKAHRQLSRDSDPPRI
ncbi:MAG: catalase, partial [Betaproteobacteria bacterium]|nr:catalase [Betaproteobacteria bacterium]